MADTLVDAVRFTEDNLPSTQTAQHPLVNLLASFMSTTPSPQKHGNKTQQEEWEIHPPNDTQTTQTETIIDEYSAINPSG